MLYKNSINMTGEVKGDIELVTHIPRIYSFTLCVKEEEREELNFKVRIKLLPSKDSKNKIKNGDNVNVIGNFYNENNINCIEAIHVTLLS